MEEVDSIILHFLRQLNVNISQDVKSICELPVEVIIQSASRCLTEINHGLKLPMKFPTGISHRIEVASQIASICKDMGYKNDVGYQTFLYYNEADLRQVFMFLIENLPNESKQTAKTSNPNKSYLLEGISNKIAEELNTIWIPPCCNNSKQVIGDFICIQETSDNQDSSKIEHEKAIILKLKEINCNNYTEEPLIELKNKVNEAYPEETRTLKELQELTVMLRQKLDSIENERNVMDVEYSQIKKSQEKMEAEMKMILTILKGVGIVDIDSESNIDNVLEFVQNNIGKLHKKSEQLTTELMTLKINLDKVQVKMDNSGSERAKCIRVLAALKEEAKAMKEEYDKNEETKNNLKKVYEISKGGKKRSIYTKRILEIISNVDKQNMEIKKILDDTRQLQKEINTLEGQLDRCFSIADETLFKDAKKDDQAKKAYKLLALLHSECSTIVSLVNDTGSMAREIVDLEDHIKTEKAKRTEYILQKIHLDLAEMKQEHINSIHYNVN